MNSEYVNVAHSIIIVLTTVLIVGIWGTFLYYGFRKCNYTSILRSTTVLGLFIVWLATILVQNWLSPDVNMIMYYSILSYVGYFVFPLALIALWRVVFLHAGDYIKFLFSTRRDRTFTINIATFYGVFYLFASGMLSLADPNIPPLTEQWYVTKTETYGPISIWPTLEFWLPTFHLFGSISFAGVFMLLSLVGLISIGVGLVVYQWRLKKKWDLKVVGSTLGSSVAVTATCFVSCSLPAVYPLLIGVFGPATAEPIAQLIGNKTGVLVNLLQMAVLSLMVGSISLTAQRLKTFESRVKLSS